MENIKFAIKYSINKSLIFEKVFEEELQMDFEDKRDILRNGINVWMFLDSKPCGEFYGKKANLIEENIPDLKKHPNDFYVYSLTILPEFQGKGLSKILFAYALGMVKQSGFKKVILHSTSEGMDKISYDFGFLKGKRYENWFDSGRPAEFRYLKI